MSINDPIAWANFDCNCIKQSFISVSGSFAVVHEVPVISIVIAFTWINFFISFESKKGSLTSSDHFRFASVIFRKVTEWNEKLWAAWRWLVCIWLALNHKSKKKNKYGTYILCVYYVRLCELQIWLMIKVFYKYKTNESREKKQQHKLRCTA